jgi:hypothetical protein
VTDEEESLTIEKSIQRCPGQGVFSKKRRGNPSLLINKSYQLKMSFLLLNIKLICYTKAI